MNKPFAWSYSALTSFETCPRRHYLTKISKEVVEPQTEALTWGNRVHKALENRLKGFTLQDEMAAFEDQAAAVLRYGGTVEAEAKVALNRQFSPVEYFAKDVWVRGVLDWSVVKGDTMVVGDWKTGKPDPDSAQLKLFAAMAMARKPFVKKVKTVFVWLKTNEVTAESYVREDIPAIWQEFTPRVQAMENAVASGKFPPRPSGLCRKWCPVPASKCEYRET